MMAPQMAAEAIRAYAEETNGLNRERRASGEGHRSELAKIQRTLKQMLSSRTSVTVHSCGRSETKCTL